MTDQESHEHIKNADIDQIIKQRSEEMKLADNNSNMTSKLSDFDVKKFNMDFDVEKALKDKQRRQRERAKLTSMEKPEVKKKIYQLSVSEILIGLKDTWFDILDDLLQQRFTLSIFTKGNRLFFIGLTITIIVLILYLYDVLTEEETATKQETTVKEVHHIYHIVKPEGDSTQKVINNQIYNNIDDKIGQATQVPLPIEKTEIKIANPSSIQL